MTRYLLDTNIVVFYIKGKFSLNQKFDNLPPKTLFISEITLAELWFGVENSELKEKNERALQKFLTGVQILPIYQSIKLYAKEKARLRKTGKRIDDLDLLIGVTAVTYNLVMVTNNTSHFERIKEIQLVDWTKS